MGFRVHMLLGFDQKNVSGEFRHSGMNTKPGGAHRAFQLWLKMRLTAEALRHLVSLACAQCHINRDQT